MAYSVRRRVNPGLKFHFLVVYGALSTVWARLYTERKTVCERVCYGGVPCYRSVGSLICDIYSVGKVSVLSSWWAVGADKQAQGCSPPVLFAATGTVLACQLDNRLWPLRLVLTRLRTL